MSEEQRVAINPEFLWQLKWWAFGGRFPLIPQWKYKQSNKYNTSNFWFHWLGFRIWTIDSPSLGFSLELDDQNLEIRLRLPYLITGFWMPLFPYKFSQKTWRKVPRAPHNNNE